MWFPGSKPSSYDTDTMFSSGDTKSHTIGGSKYPEKTSYLSTTYSSDLKYSPSKISSYDCKNSSYEGKNSSYDVSPNTSQPTGGGLLNVEDTPTPTSSIETEDSNTREVGEKDVEGDGEQSDWIY